jgi:hypothetical protein
LSAISNTFDSLGNSSISSEVGEPIGASSPKQKDNQPRPSAHNAKNTNLKVIMINFQSIKSKREVFWNLIDYSNPDIILGCKTWLNPSIRSQVVMPPGYNTYRKDRSDGYGCILKAVKSTYSRSQIDKNLQSEMVAVHITGESSRILLSPTKQRP